MKDVIILNITPEMLTEARAGAEELKSKWVYGTRGATTNRDIIGSLAHQAVEIKLKEWGMPFESYRKVKYQGGDKGDLKYENDLIDIKGTGSGWLKDNRDFLVFANEIPKMKAVNITHLCFVVVKLEEEKIYIYGVIPFDDFLEISEPLKLTWDNLKITADKLTPFIDYINHT